MFNRQHASLGLLMWSMTQPKWVQAIVDAFFRTYDWCERVYYCHHNARVLSDMEYRFGCVLCEVTAGMSKAYYDIEDMRVWIADKRQSDDEQAVEDFIEELSDDVSFTIVELCEQAGANTNRVLARRAEWAKRTKALVE